MISVDGEVLRIEGPVTFETVPQLLTGSAAHIAAGVRRVDFSAATAVDSAAVALALEWRRQAAGAALVFEHMPEAMLNLAALYGVSELLQPSAA